MKAYTKNTFKKAYAQTTHIENMESTIFSSASVMILKSGQGHQNCQEEKINTSYQPTKFERSC